MEIKYDVLEKELNTGDLKSIYLFYGNESYLIEQALKKVKKNFGKLVQGINYVLVDETNEKDFIFNMEVPAFGYDKKLIVVKNSSLFKKDGRKKEPTAFQKEVAEYIETNNIMLQEMANLVFVEEEINKNVVYDVVNKHGTVCKIDELKLPQLVMRLKKVCAMYRVNVDEKTLQYLLENVGTNLQVLMNEIRKLIEYAGEGGTITCKMVDQLAVKQMESVIFELTDYLGNKKTAEALEVLERLIYQKEPLQKILVTLYNHFKKLYLCTIALKLNRDIVESLDLKPNQTFLVNKYKKQVTYFKESELEQLLHEFVKMDEQSKNGRMDLEVALKSVLCRYCSA